MSETQREHLSAAEVGSDWQDPLPKKLDEELEAVLAQFSQRVEVALKKLEEAKTITQEDLQFEVRI